jgi:cytochrome P450
LISQHPETEKKILKELSDVLGNRSPGPEDMDNLTYTRMVLTESMRLYPPVWTMARRAIDDYKVGEYILPSKSVIFFSQYLIQRDPRFYDAPDLFIPERWTKDNENSRPQYAYFPFGGGPRRCIGEQFAWMEGILLLATLVKRWKMNLAPGQRVEMNPLITLRPKFGLKMIIEKRPEVSAKS